MRALCGAIITAGALIGMGLASIGFGTRYHTSVENVDKAGEPILLHLSQMDRPLVFILVFLTCVVVIGLALAMSSAAALTAVSAAPAQAAVATTGPATQVKATSALLTGTVASGGNATFWEFEYGRFLVGNQVSLAERTRLPAASSAVITTVNEVLLPPQRLTE